MNAITASRPRRKRHSTLRQLATLLVNNGRWWLVPMVAVLCCTSVLLMLITAIEYVAPFVYSMF